MGQTVHLLVLVTPDLPMMDQTLLLKHFDQLKVVDYIHTTWSVQNMTVKARAVYEPWITRACTKWRIFEATENDPRRVIFLDADTALNFKCITSADIEPLLTIKSPAMWFESPWSTKFRSDFALHNYFDVNKHGDQVHYHRLFYALSSKVKSYVGCAAIMIFDPLALREQCRGSPMKLFLKELPTYRLYDKCMNGHDEQAITQFFLRRKQIMYHVGTEFVFMAWHKHMLEPNKKVLGYHFFGVKKPWYVLPESPVVLTSNEQDEIKKYEDFEAWLSAWNI